MTEPSSADAPGQVYDRSFLLSPDKRNQLMELWEVEKYGQDCFSDPNYVSIYGVSPPEWYARGIRLLARTTLECVRDPFGDLIGRDVKHVLREASPAHVVVIDPFAGSCNALYWMLCHLENARGIAFEIERMIYDLTYKNLLCVDAEIELLCGDYRARLGQFCFPREHMLVVFVDPPWADALDEINGLDLARTQSPVGEIVDYVGALYRANRLLFVTKVHEKIVPASLSANEARFDWCELCIYDINAEGQRHGILLGTQGWTPERHA
jgi:16S rRNA G966 N2-methylase RsmD